MPGFSTVRRLSGEWSGGSIELCFMAHDLIEGLKMDTDTSRLIEQTGHCPPGWETAGGDARRYISQCCHASF